MDSATTDIDRAIADIQRDIATAQTAHEQAMVAARQANVDEQDSLARHVAGEISKEKLDSVQSLAERARNTVRGWTRRIELLAEKLRSLRMERAKVLIDAEKVRLDTMEAQVPGLILQAQVAWAAACVALGEVEAASLDLEQSRPGGVGVNLVNELARDWRGPDPNQFEEVLHRFGLERVPNARRLRGTIRLEPLRPIPEEEA